MEDKINRYKEKLKNLDALEICRWALNEFGIGKVLLASSLGAEDQVLTAMLASLNKEVRIATLDTGRHFQETYDVMDESAKQFGIHYEVQFPEPEDIQNLMKEGGPNLFYNSVDLRKRCCFVRKVKPLGKILKTVDAWITGLRASQSDERKEINVICWDADHGIYKINPLYNWSEQDVWGYIRENQVPYNKLHDRGFPSIGCAPCTRAVKEGEPVRAGRWWWESPEHKECGIHIVNGKVVRKGGNHG